jgi:hypothetical protein
MGILTPVYVNEMKISAIGRQGKVGPNLFDRKLSEDNINSELERGGKCAAEGRAIEQVLRTTIGTGLE